MKEKEIKPRPNHRIYIKILRKMSPEQRLKKAIELSKLARQLSLHGFRKCFPYRSEEEIKKLFLEYMQRWWDRTY